MTGLEIPALVAVGAVAGIVSTVASLASVVSYPALLAFGLPPLAANMTNTVALLFTGAGAAAGSRQELAGQGGRVRRLGLVTACGGGAGAALLLLTPAQTFQRAAPVLIAGASLLLLRPRREGQPGTGRGNESSGALLAALFGVAMYVGYFGAAGGILMLAVLTPLLAEPMARANAVKNVISGLANGVAAVAFAVAGQVDWAVVAPLAAGFLVGGAIGPALVRRLPGRMLRAGVGLAGLAVAVRLGISAYS